MMEVESIIRNYLVGRASAYIKNKRLDLVNQIRPQ